MRPTFWQRLDAVARRQIPLTGTVLLILIGVIPSHLPGLGQVGPMLSLISIYYWAVHRPDVLGHGSVFVLGLLEDAIAGTPLGSGSLVLLLVHGGVIAQYKFFHGKPFALTWCIFGVIAALAVLVRWVCISMLQGMFVSMEAPFFAYLMSVTLYPLVGWVLSRVQLCLLRDV